MNAHAQDAQERKRAHEAFPGIAKCGDTSNFPSFAREACATIAPTWPLDRFIAVNPWWGRVEQPIEDAAAHEGALSGTSFLMPLTYYRDLLLRGDFTLEHLSAAIARTGDPFSAERVKAEFDVVRDGPVSLPLLSDLMDASGREHSHSTWNDAITHQISQYCAAYFDERNSSWRPERSQGLYGGWKRTMGQDLSIRMLMGDAGISTRARGLPDQAHELLKHAIETLGFPEARRREFAEALLRRINGWAAWCAYKGWEARLAGFQDDHILELLCIRLAWELLLDDGKRDARSRHAVFVRAWNHFDSRKEAWKSHQRIAWICQNALEIATQESLKHGLSRRLAQEREVTRPKVQAVFCIDVRSEIFRRAWETTDAHVQTLGFAGFFGIPAQYAPFGTRSARPRLPGLFSPSMSLEDLCDDASASEGLVKRRRSRLGLRSIWKTFQTRPTSMFTFAETAGVVSLFALIGRSFPRPRPAESVDGAGLSADELKSLRPRLSSLRDGGEETLESRTALASKVLRSMCLARDFARLIILIGHGSQTLNNAHASGLDCGACCGQSGEVNARALAFLLNDAQVRERLRHEGIEIPDETCFLAGLHNTATDEVHLFDLDLLPATHIDDCARMQGKLRAAGDAARRERAAALGVATRGRGDEDLLKEFRKRANDWAEVRPEWGLAGNAAFIVAPRTTTKALDLRGQAFLQEYDWRQDSDGSVLEAILTAPMVVAHWINMQYYASTVDQKRYGSGNKVLHNVVGGDIGVFEGNGGDLRIGLPLQSVWNGESFVHTPRRLSVFVEAPEEFIEKVTQKHAVVKNLVENKWVFLFRIS